MKKIFELLIFLLLLSLAMLAISCGGTRQSAIEKHEDLTVQNSYSEGSKIVLGNTFTYTPFDNLKPMVIEGKVYKNAIVSNDKRISKETYKHFNVYHHYRLDGKKEITRTDNTWLYIGLFAILVLGVLAWFKLPSFRKVS